MHGRVITMMSRWVANAMEEVMEKFDLFHCSFCYTAKDDSERAVCEGPEYICTDCHGSECPTRYECYMNGNFYDG